MKAICTSVLLFMSLGIAAQSNLVEFPYNPDADGNDIIGTADLMMLLSIFGDEFSEEGLYLNEDSTSAIIYLGEHDYPQCAYSCSLIPGHWAIMKLEDLPLVKDEVEFADHAYLWLESPLSPSKLYNITWNNSTWNFYNGNYFSAVKRCYCSTRELPHVEYSYCWVDYYNEVDFEACVTEKVSSGWYPIGGISVAGPGNVTQGAQAFWRWAD